MERTPIFFIELIKSLHGNSCVERRKNVTILCISNGNHDIYNFPGLFVKDSPINVKRIVSILLLEAGSSNR